MNNTKVNDELPDSDTMNLVRQIQSLADDYDKSFGMRPDTVVMHSEFARETGLLGMHRIADMTVVIDNGAPTHRLYVVRRPRDPKLEFKRLDLKCDHEEYDLDGVCESCGIQRVDDHGYCDDEQDR